MVFNKNEFPLCDMTPAEAGMMRVMWSVSRGGISPCLEAGRVQLRKNSALTHHLRLILTGALRETGAPADAGRLAFTTGTLAVAGVFGMFNPGKTLPVLGGALEEVGNMHSAEFIAKSNGAVDDRAQLHGLLEGSVLPLLGAASAHDDLLFGGAGALLLVAERSERRLAKADMSEFEALLEV